MKNFNQKHLEIVSAFSALAGQSYDAITSDGRMISWSSNVHWAKGNYWLSIIIDDSGTPNILINSSYVDDAPLYAVIGYCTYHKINYELDES